jgi:Immunity protein family (Imm11)
MAYFVMVCEGEYPIMPIAKGPRVPGLWRSGRPLRVPVTPPLVYTLDRDYPGTPKAMYYEQAVPVMRADVIQVLRKAGVDNIEYFDAILENPLTGQPELDYKAFNIIGAVAAADMGASELMGTSSSTIGDVDFHALTLDESRTGGLLLFRLAEALNAIVVHESVRKAIEAAGIPGFVFYGPGTWSG